MLRSTRQVTASLLLLVALLLASTPLAAQTDDISLEGAVLEVVVKDDLFRGHHEMEYGAKHGSKRYTLKFRGDAPEGLRTGQRVRLKGKRGGTKTIYVSAAQPENFEINNGAATYADLAAAAGIRQILFLKIQSATAVSAASAAQLASVMSAMDAWYLASSFNTLSFKSDRDANGIIDFYTVMIPDSSAGVGEGSAFTFCSKAKSNAATQHGITASQWNHVVCILPPDMNYSWFGQAYIGGSDSVINGNYAHSYSGGYTHELGHNLGMHHANAGTTEYGDTSCVMGGNAGTARRHFNGPHTHQMGWTAAAAAGPGTFQLSAIEAQPAERTSDLLVLKIRDSVAAQDLYISYRAPLGAFSSSVTPQYKTAVHRWSGGSAPTYLLAHLGDGESYTQNGITITQLSHSTTSASIQIGAQCAAAAPTVTVAPASHLTSSADPAQYQVTVRNNDVNCSGATSFALSAALPDSGWSAQFGSASLSPAPGASASTILTVTPPAALASGSYSLAVNVTATGHPAATAALQYVQDTSAPSAVTSLTATLARKGAVSLKWNASTDVGSGVANYDIIRNGTVIASSSSLSFTDKPGTGQFTYSVVARDRAGNESAPGNSVTVSTSVTGGGGKGGRK